ncbi:HD domain-containing protein [Nocardia takedensis]
MAGPEGFGWDWATRTGGTLSAGQRWRLRGALTREIPALLATRAAWAAKRGRGRLEFDGLRVPDSGLARVAEEKAREALSAAMLEHSYRTYFFGRVLAELEGARYDDELVYVACLLHDLNLENPTAGRCFAVVGGERAAAFALDNGAPAERATAIGAAIAAHVTPGVAGDLTDPGGFVSAGAAVDVVGARLGELDRAWVADLLTRHPRHELKRHLVAAFRAEAAAVPAGRVALMLTAGFNLTVRLAPFPE